MFTVSINERNNNPELCIGNVSGYGGVLGVWHSTATQIRDSGVKLSSGKLCCGVPNCLGAERGSVGPGACEVLLQV